MTHLESSVLDEEEIRLPDISVMVQSIQKRVPNILENVQTFHRLEYCIMIQKMFWLVPKIWEKILTFHWLGCCMIMRSNQKWLLKKIERNAAWLCKASRNGCLNYWRIFWTVIDENAASWCNKMCLKYFRIFYFSCGYNLHNNAEHLEIGA